ncbi:hypothetical protein JW823_09240 [bacterium]|nr:hypothetical protein [candidate division CSSED10-310 bacterium]
MQGSIEFSRRTRAAIWLAALILTSCSAIFQRMTGPTCPYRGSYDAEGTSWVFKVKRNPLTEAPLRVTIPAPASLSGQLVWREYPSERPWKTVDMIRAENRLEGLIPVQPAAGKVEYFIQLETASSDHIRIPDGDKKIIARYKDDVPAWALIPHIIFMFTAMLMSNRLGIGLAFRENPSCRQVWCVFITLTLGGLVLGPIVQWNAFGAAWMGWPYGHDLTDNKSAVLWIAWLIPVLSILRKKDYRRSTLVASVLTLLVYLIPHSLMGSEHIYTE